MKKSSIALVVLALLLLTAGSWMIAGAGENTSAASIRGHSPPVITVNTEIADTLIHASAIETVSNPAVNLAVEFTYADTGASKSADYSVSNLIVLLAEQASLTGSIAHSYPVSAIKQGKVEASTVPTRTCAIGEIRDDESRRDGDEEFPDRKAAGVAGSCR